MHLPPQPLRIKMPKKNKNLRALGPPASQTWLKFITPQVNLKKKKKSSEEPIRNHRPSFGIGVSGLALWLRTARMPPCFFCSFCRSSPNTGRKTFATLATQLQPLLQYSSSSIGNPLPLGIGRGELCDMFMISSLRMAPSFFRGGVYNRDTYSSGPEKLKEHRC